MVKHKIYPTHHKKYVHCTIKEKSKDSFTVIIDTKHSRDLPKRIIRKRSNFITYKKALRYLRKKAKKYNLPIKNMIYDRGSHCECSLTMNKVMKFDKEDIDKVQQHIIHAHKNGNGINADYYAHTEIQGKTVRFHNIIMNHDVSINKTITVDHIVPGDALNNQKKNLRLGTKREQSINRRARKNNKSGYKGVFYIQSKNAWLADWKYEKGKGKTKSFPCKKYGEKKAKQMAIDYRAKMVSNLDDYRRFMTFK